MSALKIIAVSAGVALSMLLLSCALQPRVSYQQDVAPIIEKNCAACHRPPDGRGYLQSGLKMDSWQALMRGASYGRVIVPGDSRHSILNMLVEGRVDPTMRTPHPLTEAEIETLKLWVDQGAANN